MTSLASVSIAAWMKLFDSARDCSPSSLRVEDDRQQPARDFRTRNGVCCSVVSAWYRHWLEEGAKQVNSIVTKLVDRDLTIEMKNSTYQRRRDRVHTF